MVHDGSPCSATGIKGCRYGLWRRRALTFAMAVMNPDYRFVGIESDRNMVRQARDLYQLSNLEFVGGDILDAGIEPSSVDAIITFILHEIYSA